MLAKKDRVCSLTAAFHHLCPQRRCLKAILLPHRPLNHHRHQKYHCALAATTAGAPSAGDSSHELTTLSASPGYTLIMIWCPSCKKSLINECSPECYTCQDQRFYHSLQYKDELLGRLNDESTFWMPRVNVFFFLFKRNKHMKDKKRNTVLL